MLQGSAEATSVALLEHVDRSEVGGQLGTHSHCADRRGGDGDTTTLKVGVSGFMCWIVWQASPPRCREVRPHARRTHVHMCSNPPLHTHAHTAESAHRRDTMYGSVISLPERAVSHLPSTLDPARLSSWSSWRSYKARLGVGIVWVRIPARLLLLLLNVVSELTLDQPCMVRYRKRAGSGFAAVVSPGPDSASLAEFPVAVG